MKPISPAIIEALQASTRLHWAAIEHYSTLAAHLTRLGYVALAKKANEDADDERAHLNRLLGRLEVFATAPATDHAAPVWPRNDVPGILNRSLELEQSAAAVERAGILTAREDGDEVTAEIFSDLLESSETSIAEIETQLALIAALGLQNYLTNAAQG